MKPGIYTFYIIEFRTTHKSPWLKPKEKLQPIERDIWRECGRDSFGRSINPHIGTGNDWRPKFKAADEDFHAVAQNTGHFGWTKLDSATRALTQLRKDDAEGMYDSRDGYQHLEQAVRHEFQIKRMEMTYNLTSSIVSEEGIAA